ncbi:MAG: cAMP-binding protein [Lysinibacillus sp.]
MEKQNEQQISKSKAIEQIQQVYGLSKEDSEALLVHAAEVDTSHPIPIELIKLKNVDSTLTTLNNLQEDNPSTILDRNGPKDSYNS